MADQLKPAAAAPTATTGAAKDATGELEAGAQQATTPLGEAEAVADAAGTTDPEEPQTTTDAGDRIPTVVADGVHVVYKVTSAGARGTAASALQRMIFKRSTETRGQSGVVEVHAVRGVSFTAYRGESIGLLGRNGSGKSTLLRAIAGLLPAADGAVYTSGRASLLGVNAALMDDLTGERNIVLGCLAMGMTTEETERLMPSIIEFAGLEEKFIHLPMRTYSSGMAARLRFAIAAAKSHEILLVDEALATGDQDFQQKSEKRIKELREQAGTVFVVSHSLKVITETCTRAIWLDKGQVKQDGAAEEVVAAYLNETRRR